MYLFNILFIMEYIVILMILIREEKGIGLLLGGIMRETNGRILNKIIHQGFGAIKLRINVYFSI